MSAAAAALWSRRSSLAAQGRRSGAASCRSALPREPRRPTWPAAIWSTCGWGPAPVMSPTTRPYESSRPYASSRPATSRPRSAARLRRRSLVDVADTQLEGSVVGTVVVGPRHPRTSLVMDVVLAAGGAPWETAAISEIEGSSNLRLVRRCVDVADLLAIAETDVADAALVHTELSGLDADAVHRLERAGVRVAAVEADEERCLGLGIARRVALGCARRAHPRHRRSDRRASPTDRGSIVAVWGPTGAPDAARSRSALAAAAAAKGVDTVLVDADTYGGSLAQMLAVLDDVSGLMAACRAANNGHPGQVDDHLLHDRPAAATAHRTAARRHVAADPARRARAGAAPASVDRRAGGDRLRLRPRAGARLDRPATRRRFRRSSRPIRWSRSARPIQSAWRVSYAVCTTSPTCAAARHRRSWSST